MSIKIMEDSPETCRQCGERPAFYKAYGPEFGLCSECAEAVANLYWIAHAGELLTWPRTVQPTERPKPVDQRVKWRVLRRDSFTCQECGCTDRPLHVDHVVARANGGSNDENNLQALCDKCNLRKGAK